jgi:hypothetical protein
MTRDHQYQVWGGDEDVSCVNILSLFGYFEMKNDMSNLPAEDLSAIGKPLGHAKEFLTQGKVSQAKSILNTIVNKLGEHTEGIKTLQQALQKIDTTDQNTTTKLTTIIWILQKHISNDLMQNLALKPFPTNKVFYEAKNWYEAELNEDAYYIWKDYMIFSDGAGNVHHNDFAHQAIEYFKEHIYNISNDADLKSILLQMPVNNMPASCQLWTLVIVKKEGDKNIIYNIWDSEIFIDGQQQEMLTSPIFGDPKTSTPRLSNQTQINVLSTSSDHIIIMSDGATKNKENAMIIQILKNNPHIEFAALKALLKHHKNSENQHHDDTTLIDLRP